MPTKIDDDKKRRMHRGLAATAELMDSMAEDWDVEYRRFKSGELVDDPRALETFASMHEMMGWLCESARPVMGLLSTMSVEDKEKVDAQYAKLLQARNKVQQHDEHFSAALSGVAKSPLDEEGGQNGGATTNRVHN
jgi:hypothetical protein